MKYPKGKMTEEDKKYYAEMDLRTLTDAREIKADKPRLRRAMNYAKEQMKALESTMYDETKPKSKGTSSHN